MAEKQHLVETIANLKRALAARSDGSESDDSIAYTSNRGRKLKRKARYVHEGALNDAKGPEAYRKEIEFFGKRRKIIFEKKPRKKRNDDSESELEGDSDDEDTSLSDDLDPYSEIKIGKILAPCENAADLPSHPSLSHIYTSRTLNDLLQQSLTKLCEEQTHTTKLKNLLTVFLGDDPFINLEKMQWTEEDFGAMARERSEMLLQELDLAFGDRTHSARGSLSGVAPAKPTLNGDTSKNLPPPPAPPPLPPPQPPPPPRDSPIAPPPPPATTSPLNPAPPEDAMDIDPPPAVLKTEPTTPPTPPRRMTTRSTQNSHQNSVPASPTTTAPAPPIVEVDQWFFPPSFRIDPDFGLPAPEAAETRHLLSSAVQHQDEFLRGLNKVREGLLRAERFRKSVWSWCRAMEGARDYLGGGGGDGVDDAAIIADLETGVALSDGEDYYDPVVWGLDEPLEKGKEEEEENGGEVVSAGKKTRGRRTVGN